MFGQQRFSIASSIGWLRQIGLKLRRLTAGSYIFGWVMVAGGLALSLHGLGQLGKSTEQVVVEQVIADQVSCPNLAVQPARMVDISGAVVKPGLYPLPAGSRLGAVVEAAGGFAKDANTVFIAKNLNLAQELKDGDKIYVPYAGEDQGEGKEIVASDGSGASPGLISINTASKKELETLEGIGAVRAEAIIDGRPYASLNELVTEGVLSESVFSKIEKSISL